MNRQFTISHLLQFLFAFWISLIIYALFVVFPYVGSFIIWLLVLKSTLWSVRKKRRTILSIILAISIFAVYFILCFYPLNLHFRLVPPFLNANFVSIPEAKNLLKNIINFLHPAKTDMIIAIGILIPFIFAEKSIYRKILHRTPNYYFEFVASVLPNASLKNQSQLIRFVQQFLLSFLLAFVAFYLLGIESNLAFALLFGLFSLVPYLGIFLGGIYLILLLPDSGNLLFQIVGIIIAVAVIWFVGFIFLNEKTEPVLNILQAPVLLVVSTVTYFLFGLAGVLFLIPVFLIALSFIESLAFAAPLLHHQNNLLRKILLA